jgi:hypothetical protein
MMDTYFSNLDLVLVQCLFKMGFYRKCSKLCIFILRFGPLDKSMLKLHSDVHTLTNVHYLQYFP